MLGFLSPGGLVERCIGRAAEGVGLPGDLKARLQQLDEEAAPLLGMRDEGLYGCVAALQVAPSAPSRPPSSLSRAGFGTGCVWNAGFDFARGWRRQLCRAARPVVLADGQTDPPSHWLPDSQALTWTCRRGLTRGAWAIVREVSEGRERTKHRGAEGEEVMLGMREAGHEGRDGGRGLQQWVAAVRLVLPLEYGESSHFCRWAAAFDSILTHPGPLVRPPRLLPALPACLVRGPLIYPTCPDSLAPRLYCGPPLFSEDLLRPLALRRAGASFAILSCLISDRTGWEVRMSCFLSSGVTLTAMHAKPGIPCKSAVRISRRSRMCCMERGARGWFESHLRDVWRMVEQGVERAALLGPPVEDMVEVHNVGRALRGILAESPRARAQEAASQGVLPLATLFISSQAPNLVPVYVTVSCWMYCCWVYCWRWLVAVPCFDLLALAVETRD